MTDNGKMIEEAAKVIYDDDPDWGYVYEDDHGEYAANWGYLPQHLQEKFRAMAARALAVFEEAHAPTSDEREALETVIAKVWANFSQQIGPTDAEMTEAILAAGFRRSEVPEPSGVCDHDWVTLIRSGERRCRKCEATKDGIVDCGGDHCVSHGGICDAKSQDEPSDANAGVGWFEWFKMPENTTEIAYVHENGEVFDPVRGWNPPEFTIAAAERNVHRLVRAAAARGAGGGR